MIKATAGVISTAVDGTDYYSSSYAIPNANIGNGRNNCSTALQTQVVVANTNYYITGSQLTFPATSKTGGGVQVGTRIFWRIGMMKTAAGTGNFAISIYRGTNGTTADTQDVNQTIGVSTGVVDNMTLDIMLVITATGGAGSYYWSIMPTNKAVTNTGFGITTGTTAFRNGTVSAVALNTASLIFGIAFRNTTGTPTITIPFCTVNAENLT
jgi:hypothetical protein